MRRSRVVLFLLACTAATLATWACGSFGTSSSEEKPPAPDVVADANPTPQDASEASADSGSDAGPRRCPQQGGVPFSDDFNRSANVQGNWTQIRPPQDASLFLENNALLATGVALTDGGGANRLAKDYVGVAKRVCASMTVKLETPTTGAGYSGPGRTELVEILINVPDAGDKQSFWGLSVTSIGPHLFAEVFGGDDHQQQIAVTPEPHHLFMDVDFATATATLAFDGLEVKWTNAFVLGDAGYPNKPTLRIGASQFATTPAVRVTYDDVEFIGYPP